MIARLTERDPDEHHRVATPLELFVDLASVIAIASAAVGTQGFDGIGDLLPAESGAHVRPARRFIAKTLPYCCPVEFRASHAGKPAIAAGGAPAGLACIDKRNAQAMGFCEFKRGIHAHIAGTDDGNIGDRVA